MHKIICFTLLIFASLVSFSQPLKTTGGNTAYAMQEKTITVYVSSDGTGERLKKLSQVSFEPAKQPTEPEYSVFVNPAITFQTFVGMGGAITDASAETFAKLPRDKQKEFIDAYYNPETGIGYTLARTSIHSCDFSIASYTYVEEGDKDLKTFSVDHDKTFRIPLIRQAMQAAGGQLKIFASPWSPPAFMKDNNDMLQGGRLLPAYADSWANYYVKFIKAYEQQGIPIWGITIQNEPMAKQVWESCLYTAAEERDFLKNYLGPLMQKEGLGERKIIVWDHNRDLMVDRANTIFGDPEAAQYAWGLGFHWYETWTGGEPMYANVARVHEAFPSKNLLFTEGCVERFDSTKYAFWGNGERYGKAIINDLNAGAVGWTDWNILLDEKGGPNHVGNYCFAPIHADTRNGKLIYTPSYYFIGHFSKFIRPNAKRVSTASSRSQLLAVSFLNSDGTLVTVVMNTGDQPVTYNLVVSESEAKIKMPAHSIQTLVY